MSLTYTDHRCAKITHKLITLLKNITPLYRLNIIWRNNKLSKLYSPRLKLGVPTLQKNCSCYKFKCPCGIPYVGETKRILETRIIEHQQPSRNSPIYKHIEKCPVYSLKLHEIYDQPNRKEEKKFFYDQFEILGSNLVNRTKRTAFEAAFIA